MKRRRARCSFCAPSSRRLVPIGQVRCARCNRNWNRIRNIKRRMERSSGMRLLARDVMAWMRP